MEPRLIRFGIIGLGVIAPAHRDGIENAPGATLVAACDVDEERGKKFLAESQGPVKFYKDYHDLLADDSVEAVSVCTPPYFHSEISIEAAKAGKHVLVEKPIETSLEKTDAMIEAARSAAVKLGCVFQRRTYPPNRKAREAIRKGLLGKMILGDGYFKDYRVDAYYTATKWRGTYKFDGGGALMAQAIHGIDLLLWVMDSEVKSVFARAGHLVRKMEAEDTAVAVLEYKNGAFGVIEGTTSVSPREIYTVKLHGERGTIHLTDAGIERWAISDDPNLEARDNQEEHLKRDPTDYQSGHRGVLADFVEAVRENREPLATGVSARHSLALILAIYESARKGKEVPVR